MTITILIFFIIGDVASKIITLNKQSINVITEKYLSDCIQVHIPGID